jgi:hypothetical protein
MHNIDMHNIDTHRRCGQSERAGVTTGHRRLPQPGCFTAVTTIVTFSRPRVGLAASRSRQTTVRRELVESKCMERRPVRLGTGTVSSSASFNIWRCVIAMSNRKRCSRTLRVPQQVWLFSHTRPLGLTLSRVTSARNRCLLLCRYLISLPAVHLSIVRSRTDLPAYTSLSHKPR